MIEKYPGAIFLKELRVRECQLVLICTEVSKGYCESTAEPNVNIGLYFYCEEAAQQNWLTCFSSQTSRRVTVLIQY